jgi:hypothetical protein
MNPLLDLDDQNKVTVMPNFRMVALKLDMPIKLWVVLENENFADRAEIEDVAAEFDSLLLGLNAGAVQFDVKVVVDARQIPLPDPSSWRLVFRRREN